MKKVFSSSIEVIHVFAQQKQSEGRSSNVYFEGTTRLYSYGRHYPLVLFVTNKKGEKAVIINTSHHSVTTTKHISQVRYATNQYKQLFLPDNEAMKGIEQIYRYRWDETDSENTNKAVIRSISTAITHCINYYNTRLRNDTTKRKAATLEKWKAEALTECHQYINVLDWYGFKMTKEAKKALSVVTRCSPIEAREAALKAEAIDAKKREKAQALQNEVNAELMKSCAIAWLAGERTFTDKNNVNHATLQWVARNETVLLRVNGDGVETSKGVRFPLEHGLKALPLIKAAIGKGWHKNGHTIHLGHYTIDEILTNGDVKAGCHYVPFSEIERIAKELGQ